MIQLDGVTNSERLEYFIWGLMVASDSRVLSGVGNKSNKVLRIEINQDRLKITSMQDKNNKTQNKNRLQGEGD